jgi:hypothetical protein
MWSGEYYGHLDRIALVFVCSWSVWDGFWFCSMVCGWWRSHSPWKSGNAVYHSPHLRDISLVVLPILFYLLVTFLSVHKCSGGVFLEIKIGLENWVDVLQFKGLTGLVADSSCLPTNVVGMDFLCSAECWVLWGGMQKSICEGRIFIDVGPQVVVQMVCNIDQRFMLGYMAFM